MREQRTLKEPVECRGIGLHSGEQVRMRILPAPPDTGRVFCLKGASVKADVSNVVATNHSTSLGQSGVHLQTVEHLLAALSCLSIDNAVINLEGNEVPIMDGSALPFAALLRKAGTRKQGRPQPYLKVISDVECEEGDKVLRISPASHLTIDCSISFDHPLLAHQAYTYSASAPNFLAEIAGARTFGFLSEIQEMWGQGLAKGGSLENAIVVSDDAVLNKEGLRFPDEFVRHKILDLLGDLSLLGMPVVGRMTAVKPGHALHLKFLSQLLQAREGWEIITENEGVFQTASKAEG